MPGNKKIVIHLFQHLPLVFLRSYAPPACVSLVVCVIINPIDYCGDKNYLVFLRSFSLWKSMAHQLVATCWVLLFRLIVMELPLKGSCHISVKELTLLRDEKFIFSPPVYVSYSFSELSKFLRHTTKLQPHNVMKPYQSLLSNLSFQRSFYNSKHQFILINFVSVLVALNTRDVTTKIREICN